MTLSVFDLLAEQRIAEAMRRGEFDCLPGAGLPLDLREDPFVPAEQRMAHRILKNAGVVPVEVTLRRELASLRERLAGSGGGERERLCRELALVAARLGALRR